MNPNDTWFAVVNETVAGTTPATPVYNRFSHIPGSSPRLTANVLQSEEINTNRAAGKTRKNGFQIADSVRMQFKRVVAMDKFLATTLSGVWDDGVLKGGKTDTPITVQKTMYEGAVASYYRFLGGYGDSLNLSVTADANANVEFGLVGMGEAYTEVASSTYTAQAAHVPFTGLDVTNVTVDGLSVTYNELTLTVENNREAKFGFGTPYAFGVGMGGARIVTATLKFYKTDNSAETAFNTSDEPVEISVDFGAGDTGYNITIPAGVPSIADTVEDGASVFNTVTFTASYDTVTGTDIIFTHLAA